MVYNTGLRAATDILVPGGCVLVPEGMGGGAGCVRGFGSQTENNA